MDWFALLEEVQSLARTGLHYATDGYDRERYERLLSLATRQYAALFASPEGAIQARFAAELGYITPKVGADAAIFNERGEILLMERSDGTGWCLPCGWTEPNERPIDTAVRETWEETGLMVEVERLVGVFSRPASHTASPHAMVAIVHLCRVVGGTLTLSHEGLALRYWPLDEVPQWHPNHDKYARAAYAIWSTAEWLPAVSD